MALNDAELGMLISVVKSIPDTAAAAAQEAAEQAGEASVKALSQGIAPKLAADGDPERIGKAVQSRMEHEGAET